MVEPNTENLERDVQEKEHRRGLVLLDGLVQQNCSEAYTAGAVADYTKLRARCVRAIDQFKC